MQRCFRCDTPLSSDEIAIYRKLVSREALSALCLDCLAKDLGWERKALEALIDYFHRTGICCLFEPYEAKSDNL